MVYWVCAVIYTCTIQNSSKQWYCMTLGYHSTKQQVHILQYKLWNYFLLHALEFGLSFTRISKKNNRKIDQIKKIYLQFLTLQNGYHLLVFGSEMKPSWFDNVAHDVHYNDYEKIHINIASWCVTIEKFCTLAICIRQWGFKVDM